MVRERAHAKLNLVLHVGPRAADGLHPLCSLFASLDLADEVRGRPRPTAARTASSCPGVEGDEPGRWRRSRAFRERAAARLPPLRLRIDKRIPVAAGLGGGSADAAAVLRTANRIAGLPLDADELRALAARLGSDVPSQIEPRHALVTGAGELVEPVDLPPLSLVLVPDAEGLSTADVYAELDRLGGGARAARPGAAARRSPRRGAAALAARARERPRAGRALAAPRARRRARRAARRRRARRAR